MSADRDPIVIRLREVARTISVSTPGAPVTDPGVAQLGANECPFGPLPSVEAAVVAALRGRANRYPDVEMVELRSAIADFHGVHLDQVWVGAGSLDLLRMACAATSGPGDEIVVGLPAFSEYPLNVGLTGARLCGVESVDHTFDLDAMADAVSEATSLVTLCNPNNPTGTALGASAVVPFLASVPSDRLVLFDEAYREFVDDDALDGGYPDGFGLLAGHPNLIVLRTFSKAYGLANLRVGYGVGDPEVIGALRRLRVTCVVSDVAQAAALAALSAQEELAARVAEVTAERHRLRAELDALGWSTPVSHTNFVWMPTNGDAVAIVAACRAADVLVQAFGPDGVRITVGLPAENDRFLAAMATYAASRPTPADPARISDR